MFSPETYPKKPHDLDVKCLIKGLYSTVFRWPRQFLCVFIGNRCKAHSTVYYQALTLPIKINSTRATKRQCCSSITYHLCRVQFCISQNPTKCKQIRRGSVRFHIEMDPRVRVLRYSNQLDSISERFESFCESTRSFLEGHICNNIESNRVGLEMLMGGREASPTWTETNEFPVRERWGPSRRLQAASFGNRCNSPCHRFVLDGQFWR